MAMTVPLWLAEQNQWTSFVWVLFACRFDPNHCNLSPARALLWRQAQASQKGERKFTMWNPTAVMWLLANVALTIGGCMVLRHYLINNREKR